MRVRVTLDVPKTIICKKRLAIEVMKPTRIPFLTKDYQTFATSAHVWDMVTKTVSDGGVKWGKK